METKYIIKNRRKELKLTLEDVAKVCGVHLATVGRWEQGTSVRSEFIEPLAKVLQINPSALYSDNKPMQTQLGIQPIATVPVIDGVNCGNLAQAQENAIASLPVFVEDADFRLICHGESMHPTISDGDVVIIRQQPIVENGEIAVVLVNDDATLKRVYLSQDRIVLQPDNPTFSPMIYIGDEMNNIRILGKALSIVHNL